MNLLITATAGTMESNDIMITLEPAQSGGIQISLTSNVLQQFGRARLADEEDPRLEALEGLADERLRHLGRVAAEIARLEGRVAHVRTPGTPLDHREEQISISIALRRMKDVVNILHRGSDPHRADMGRAFICPDSQLHRASSRIFSRRTSGRAKSSAKSPA